MQWEISSISPVVSTAWFQFKYFIALTRRFSQQNVDNRYFHLNYHAQLSSELAKYSWVSRNICSKVWHHNVAHLAVSVELLQELVLAGHGLQELRVHVEHLPGALHHQRAAVHVGEQVGVPQLDRLQPPRAVDERGADGVEARHEGDRAQHLLQRQARRVHRVQVTLGIR